jgi:hypothetical protein
LQYWQQYFNANRNGIQSSVFLIKGHNQYLGYVWCNRHENQLNIPEYAIDTTLLVKDQNTIENALLNFVITKFQPLGVESLSITLFSVFPLVQHIVTYGATDLTSVISSLMVVILNLNQFLVKYVEFLRVVRIPQISSQWIKEQGDFNVGLQIEDQILQFKSEKNGISIHLNPEQKPERIVSIIRRIFGILVFGNFTPQELIECEYWNCPSDLLSIFQTFFPHLEGLVYPLDGF